MKTHYSHTIARPTFAAAGKVALLGTAIFGAVSLGIVPNAHAMLLVDSAGGNSLSFSQIIASSVDRSIGSGSFDLYGTALTEINVSTSGYLTTTEGGGGAFGDKSITELASESQAPVIAPLFDALVLYSGASITESVTNSYYSLTYDINGIVGNTSTERSAFQVTLFKAATTVQSYSFQPGDIFFSYGDLNHRSYVSTFTVGVAQNSANATTPFGNSTGRFTKAAFLQNFNASEEGILFRNNGDNTYTASKQSFITTALDGPARYTISETSNNNHTNVRVGENTPTNVTLAEGGTVGKLSTFQTSKLFMNGGTATSLSAQDNSTLYINDGTVGIVSASDNGKAYVLDGSFTDLATSGNGEIFVYGGSISRNTMYAYDNGSYSLFGDDLFLDFASAEYGADGNGFLGTFYNLTGTLTDGTVLNTRFFDADGGYSLGSSPSNSPLFFNGAAVTVVPEAGTLAFALSAVCCFATARLGMLGTVVLRRRNKTEALA